MRLELSTRNKIADCTRISVYGLKKCGFFLYREPDSGVFNISSSLFESGVLIEAQACPSFVDGYTRFQYTLTSPREGINKEQDYQVRLVSTPCHFGCRRFWFCCPGYNCGRRAGVLYLTLQYYLFRCRQCNELLYNSQYQPVPRNPFARVC